MCIPAAVLLAVCIFIRPILFIAFLIGCILPCSGFLLDSLAAFRAIQCPTPCPVSCACCKGLLTAFACVLLCCCHAVIILFYRSKGQPMFRNLGQNFVQEPVAKSQFTIWNLVRNFEQEKQAHLLVRYIDLYSHMRYMQSTHIPLPAAYPCYRASLVHSLYPRTTLGSACLCYARPRA